MNEFPLLPYVERFPEKAACWRLYNDALRRGELTRGGCEVPGCEPRGAIHGHHVDYSRPLDVMWLCQRHHIAWHRVNGPGLNGGDVEEMGGYGLGEVTLAGVRYGRLVVLSERPDLFNGERAWLCLCDCGKKCVRLTSRLKAYAPKFIQPRCGECARDAKTRRFAHRRERFADLYRSHGTLYGLGFAEAIKDELRDSFEKEFGPLISDVLPPLGSLRSAGLESCWASDANSDTVDGMTLQEIGDYEGVTRERIRQIEERALERLRHTAKFLVLDGTPILQPIQQRGERPKDSRQSKKPRCRGCGSAAHDRRTCPAARKVAA